MKILKFLAVLLMLFAVYTIIVAVLPSPSLATPFERLSEQYWPARLTGGQTSRGAVVFLHGLGGHYLDTWQEKNRPVLMEMFNEDEDLKLYDVWSLGYPSKITADTTSVSAIIDRVAEFLDEKTAHYHRVVLVCHSLGGLVGRGALMRSHFTKRPHQRCTFITLGTPFGSSSLANYGSLLPDVTSYQTKALKTVDPNSEILNGDWKRIRREWGPKMRHFAAFETQPIHSAVFVVPQNSATLNVDKEFSDEGAAFDANHFTICKFDDPKSPRFVKLKSWVLGTASASKELDFAKRPKGSTLQPFGTVVFHGEVTVLEDFSLPLGSHLIIKPGCTVLLRNGAILHCGGRVSAKGTAAQPITFDFDKDACSEGTLLLNGPFVEESRFEHCRFLHGNGLALDKPDPRREEKGDPLLFWYVRTQRAREVDRARYINRVGGAVVLWNASRVVFDQCEFRDNEAWNGGAAILLNSRLIVFQGCHFENNRGAFGGGALFTQSSDVRLSGCTFVKNYAAPALEERIRLYHGSKGNEDDLKSALTRPASACGGALYAGYRSQVNARDGARYQSIGGPQTECLFEANEARWAGGAAYFIETNPDSASADGSIFDSVEFVRNTAGYSGGAVHIDDSSRVHLTGGRMASNRVTKKGIDEKYRGHALVDRSRVAAPPTDSGIKFNGVIRLQTNGPESTTSNAKEDAFDVKDDRMPEVEEEPPTSLGAALDGPLAPIGENPSDIPSTLAIEDQLMVSPKSFRSAQNRKVDTLVIHHVSAIKWSTDPLLRTEHRERVEKFERDYPAAERKFDWRTCKEIFEIYGVSAHYLIDRNGRMIRLVREQDIAFHAGDSRMPDGRSHVNDFSIGIELISSHPDDDPDVRAEKVPAYTEAQYQSLIALLADLRRRYAVPAANIVGHDQIAPGRKRDPGPLFDWSRVRRAVDAAPVRK